MMDNRSRRRVGAIAMDDDGKKPAIVALLLLLFIYAAAPCSCVNANGCSSLERFKDWEIRYTTAHTMLF